MHKRKGWSMTDFTMGFLVGAAATVLAGTFIVLAIGNSQVQESNTDSQSEESRISNLEREMYEAANKEDYDQAIEKREQIKALKSKKGRNA